MNCYYHSKMKDYIFGFVCGTYLIITIYILRTIKWFICTLFKCRKNVPEHTINVKSAKNQKLINNLVEQQIILMRKSINAQIIYNRQYIASDDIDTDPNIARMKTYNDYLKHTHEKIQFVISYIADE